MLATIGVCLVQHVDQFQIKAEEHHLKDLIEMRKTDCFGETRLVPDVISSS